MWIQSIKNKLLPPVQDKVYQSKTNSSHLTNISSINQKQTPPTCPVWAPRAGRGRRRYTLALRPLPASTRKGRVNEADGGSRRSPPRRRPLSYCSRRGWARWDRAGRGRRSLGRGSWSPSRTEAVGRVDWNPVSRWTLPALCRSRGMPTNKYR